MAITVLVRSPGGGDLRLTFDGSQRVVLGRGAGCDVRLPDPTVSHRHAYLTAHGSELALFDEGSTNGTFVGGARVAPRTSRLVRSGEIVQIGRVPVELRVDAGPATRDVAAATRELALAMVRHAMQARGQDPSARLRVVEGADQGAVLPLREAGRDYLVGRGAHCDLALSDADVSREHARVVRRGGSVFVRDLGAKNGTWLGGGRLPPYEEVAWRAPQVVRAGGTVLALEEPAVEALLGIEAAPDEVLAAGGGEPAGTAAPAGAEAGGQPEGDAAETTTASALIAAPDAGSSRAARRRARWSAADLVVMAAAVSVLALSIAGLVWLLRG